MGGNILLKRPNFVGNHDDLLNTHDLTTDIDHEAITNTHNLSTDVDHDALTNYAANQHVVLPGTIANVLSNHTKAVHDALLITALGSGALAKDHGTPATDMLVNVCYGTGDPPVANTTTIGTIFFKYTA